MDIRLHLKRKADHWPGSAVTHRMSSSGGQGAGRTGRTRRDGKQQNGTAAGTGGAERPGKPAASAKQKEEKVFEDKISQVVQLTGKTKDEVVIALYDCDNDPNRAVNMLLEGDDQGQWVEKTKKKRPQKPAEPRAGDRDESRGGDDPGRGDWARAGDRSQPPRMRRGGGQDRNWKSRESWENERNSAGREGATRGGRGARRGGRGGGGRGGPARSRAAPSTAVSDSWGSTSAGDWGAPSSKDDWGAPSSRDDLGAPSSRDDWGAPSKSTDDWGAPSKSTDDWGAPSSKAPDEWGSSPAPVPASEDWDEWGGSLSDTKVFTASPAAPDQPAAAPAASASPLGPSLELGALVQPSEATAAGSAAPTYSRLAAAPPAGPLSYSSAITRSLQPPAAPPAAAPPPAVSAAPQRPPAASAAAFSSQPAAEFVAPPVSSAAPTLDPPLPPAAYPADPSAAAPSSFAAPQPASSAEPAVQQPSAGYSVQSSLASAPASFPSGYTNPPGLLYSSGFGSAAPAASVSGSALSQPLASRTGRTQKARLQPPAKIPDMPVEMPDDVSTLDVKFGGLDFGTAADEPASFPAAAAPPQNPPAVSESEPPAPFPPHARSPALGPLGSAAQTAQTSLESAPVSFPSSSSSSGPPASGSPGLTSVGSAAPAPAPVTSTAASSAGLYGAADGAGAGAGAGAGPFGQLPAVSSAPSVLPAPGFGPTAAAGTSSSFSQPESTPGGSYTAGGGLSGHSSSYSNGALLPERLGAASKTSQYDPSASSTGTAGSALSSAPSAATGGVPSAGPGSTARGSALPVTTRPGGVPSLPPGVPMPYFVGQTPGVPFYPGVPGVQPIYNYEELHALQQRLPHMQSAGGGQGRPEVSSALGSGSGAYSGLTDAKFGRHDTSSPVQAALSQQLKSHQQQQHQPHQPHQQPHHQQQQQQQQQQQPFFNPAAAGIPPNYTYAFMPQFMSQYGIYTPMPPATAAPASSGGGQYQKVAGYGAGGGFGAGFDPLGSGADFKAGGGGGFGGSSPHKSGGGAGELAAGYGKAPLAGKYDNKAFHTGTPPPFPLAGQGQSSAYGQHLFLQPLPTQHSPLVHPAHQESARGSQPKPAGKPSYGYWPGN